MLHINVMYRAYNGSYEYIVINQLSTSVTAYHLDENNIKKVNIYYLFSGNTLHIKIKVGTDGPVVIESKGYNSKVNSIERTDDISTDGYTECLIQ